jgi:hypothetical protein
LPLERRALLKLCFTRRGMSRTDRVRLRRLCGLCAAPTPEWRIALIRLASRRLPARAGRGT